MRWHDKEQGPPSLRAKAVLPHNLPSYFEMGCKWKTKESAIDATYRALGKCHLGNPRGSSPAASHSCPGSADLSFVLTCSFPATEVGDMG